MVRRISLMLLVFFIRFSLIAQLPVDPKNMLPSVTPAAPDVTTLGRYMVQAPDLANGLPQ